MQQYVIVWDLETIPDLAAVARVNGIPESDAEAASALVGDKFPKSLWHEIVTIGALVACRNEDHWEVKAIGAPHVGQRTEAELIQSFVDRIAELDPCLVSFNGFHFDLPVLRYRAMLHRVSAPGLSCRPFFHRYAGCSIDLCDVLSSYASGSKAKLDEICRTLGIEGKVGGMDGSQVRQFVQDGRIAEVAAYCQQDVIATYRVWLIHELFCGRLTREGFAASEESLFLKTGGKPKPQNTVPALAMQPA